LNDTVPLSSSPERAAGEERKVLFFYLSLTPHACQNRPPMLSHDGKTKGAAPCQPHPLACQPGAVAGQQSPAPQALL